jgi:hypothetical protein
MVWRAWDEQAVNLEEILDTDDDGEELEVGAKKRSQTYGYWIFRYVTAEMAREVTKERIEKDGWREHCTTITYPPGRLRREGGGKGKQEVPYLRGP